MEYIVAAFRSRSETIKFYDYLRSYGANVEIINTPKEAGVGCGLSVKISPEILYAVKKAAASFPARSFAGFFLIKTAGGKRYVKSV